MEQAAQQVLDARKAEEERCAALGQPCPLATLYDTDAMLKELAKAHAALDKAVDAAYGYKNPPDDARRVAFLFERYLALTTRTGV